MELFQQLGDEIETLWLAKNYNEEFLPEIAVDALKRAGLPSQLSGWDVIEWSLRQKELPVQRDLRGNFGDPPVTVYSGPRFHIDVYFWFEGTTAMHQHEFCGAFQVLMGSSIHSWYEFERRETVNHFCAIGDLSLKLCEILEKGDVQAIWPGKQYIHSLFHLDQPSATIVVRTDRSPLDVPQFEYQKPGLAIDPFFEQPTTVKKLQTLSALFRARHPDADRLAAEYLASADLHTSFQILSRIRHLLQGDQLSQLFKLDSPKSRFDQFLDVVIERHGASADILKPVFDRIGVVEEITGRRNYVTKPEHRFFMALLLNVEGRERIFELIKSRFPNADPLELVLDWTFDLAETRVVGVETTNALGIPNFGEPEMFVLECMLKGMPDDQIESLFGRENPATDVSVCVEAVAKVRSAVLFRPLMV